jgi:hypothetical protein
MKDFKYVDYNRCTYNDLKEMEKYMSIVNM